VSDELTITIRPEATFTSGRWALHVAAPIGDVGVQWKLSTDGRGEEALILRDLQELAVVATTASRWAATPPKEEE
jgi:hypothetical protein